MSKIDYDAVVLPPKEELKVGCSWVDRRAYIYRLILQTGSPRKVNQTQLAKRFGVSQGQISQDIAAIKAYIKEHMGREHLIDAEILFKKAVDDLITSDPYCAAQVMKIWNEFLFNTGKLDKVEVQNIRLDTTVDFIEMLKHIKK